MSNRFSANSAEKQAIKWLARLNATTLDPEEEQAFMAWLEASPGNQAAYIKAEQLWQQGAVLTEVQEKKRSFFLNDLLDPDSWQTWATAFSLVLVLGVFGLLLKTNTTQHTFETLVGEQQALQLNDGSQLTLNTATKVKVELENSARVVHLLQGEAFFSVKADPHKPFDVVTRSGTVRVVGTRFAVRDNGEDVIVTVIEGTVALFDEKPATTSAVSETLLVANESIGMAAAKVGAAPSSVDASAVLGWRNKQLIFRNRPLGEVIAELDRYFPQKLVLTDESIRSKEITAVIKLDELDKSLESLELSLNLHLTEDDQNNILIKQK